MSALAVAVSAGSVVFVVGFVLTLRWCDRLDELDVERRISGRVSGMPPRVDGQVARDFWAGMHSGTAWPADPHAPEPIFPARPGTAAPPDPRERP